MTTPAPATTPTTGTPTTATPTTTAEYDLSFLLDHAGYVLRTRMAAALAEVDLTPRMHCVLVHAQEAERTQAQLAEIGEMDKTTMVATMDALEKAGLAERRPSATDRRARVIAVTEAGARAAEESRRIVASVHAEALSTLAEGEQLAVLDALTRLVGGSLATPAEGVSSVRRSRERQK